MKSRVAVFNRNISINTIALLLYPCRIVSYTLIDGVRTVRYIPTLSLEAQKAHVAQV